MKVFQKSLLVQNWRFLIKTTTFSIYNWRVSEKKLYRLKKKTFILSTYILFVKYFRLQCNHFQDVTDTESINYLKADDGLNIGPGSNLSRNTKS